MRQSSSTAKNEYSHVLRSRSSAGVFALGDCFGRLHKAPGTRGVVLCGAFGLDELAARQSWCILARKLAAAGITTLQLDYSGTGDAAKSLADIKSAQIWIDEINLAADWLQQEHGVEELTFVGLKLGALLASAAAQARGGVDGLVLLAPPMNGRAYVRELGLASQMLGTSDAAKGASIDGSLDVAGFELSRRLLNSIANIEVGMGTSRPARRVLVVSPLAMHVAGLRSQLATVGSAVDCESFADYDAFMQPPTINRPFLATADKVVGWLDPDAPAAGYADPRPPLATAPLRSPDWIEHEHRFGTDGTLSGILCEPTGNAWAKSCVLILNSGRDPRVGWARGSVETARLLAANAVASLRFDFTYVGDSQPDVSGKRAKIYSKVALAEVAQALDHLEALGYRRFSVVGGCSGGYAAFVAAMNDRRIASIAIRNTQRFLWRIDDRVLVPLNDYLGQPSAAATKTKSLGRIGLGIAYRALSLSLRVMSHVTTLALFKRRRLQHAVRGFSARGGRMLAVYSEDHVALPYLQEMWGIGGQELAAIPGVRIAYVPGADHNFSGARAREAWNAMVVTFLREDWSRASG